MKNNYTKISTAKLAAYSAMAGSFIAFYSEADAQIVYNDIPDIFLSDDGTGNDTDTLDLDGDGVYDFLFDVNYTTTGSSWQLTRLWGYISASYGVGDPFNDVIGYNGAFLPYASVLYTGDNIGPEEYFSTLYNIAFLAAYYYLDTQGQWVGATDKFLGIKFKIGSTRHFGWIRMDVTLYPPTITIKDYAYNATPLEAIAAGDMGTPFSPCETPSPEVLLVTAAGAKIGWDSVDGAQNYRVHYREMGETEWIKAHTSKPRKKLEGLNCGVTYEYQVAAICTDGVSIAVSEYSPIATFTTGSCKMGADNESEVALNIMPNPAQSFINLYIEGLESEKLKVEVYNVVGELITGMQVQRDEEMQMDVSALQSGVYTVVISDGSQSVASQFVKQ